MSTMISEVYDALREAGASEEKARRAAEVLADYDSHFVKIEHDLLALRGELTSAMATLRGEFAELRGEFAELRGEVLLLKWMLGFVLAGVMTLLFKAFA